MSDYVLYLKNSSVSLKLTDPQTTANTAGRFDVRHFVPPTVAEEIILSESTSYNRWSGEAQIGSRAENINVSVPMMVYGSSEQEIRRNVSDLQGVLDLASDEYDPLYLCFKPHSYLSGEPLWGQLGAFMRYEIVSGKVHLEKYDKTRGLFQNITVQLILRPFVLGQQQRLANAYGGVRQRFEGYADGKSRGVIIPMPATNVFVNAAFIGRYGFFQDDAWIVGGGVRVSEVIDGRFRLWPSESKRLYCDGSGSGAYYQNYNCGNTNKWTISAYLKKENGSAVTASDVTMIYQAGSSLTPTFTPLTNGWYRAHVTVDGINASHAVGIRVGNGVSIYLHGMQFEEKAFPTPFCCGDLPGCYYNSTDLSAAAATSTRLTGKIVVPIEDASDYTRILHWDKGTIVVVWTPYHSDAEGVLSGWFQYILDTYPTRRIVLARDPTNRYWSFGDGTTSGTSTVDTITPGTPIVLTLTWAVGEKMKLYRDGVKVGETAANVSALVPTTYLGIGFNGGSGDQANDGTFGDFSTYAWAFTQAEVTAQYADIYSRIAQGRLESPIPYLLTRNGDGVFDSHNDGLGVQGHWAYGCADGIAGNVPADTKYDFSHNVGACQVLISNFDCKEFIPPAVLGDYSAGISNAAFWNDYGMLGDGVADANAAGGYYKSDDLTAENNITYGRLCALPNRLNLGDRDYIAIIRLKFSEALTEVVTIRCKYAPDTSAYDPSTFQLGDPKDWSTYVGKTTYTGIYSAPVHMPRFRRADAKLVGIGFERIFWWVSLISVPASIAYSDFVGMLPRPIKIITLGTTSDTRFVIRGEEVNPGKSAEAAVTGCGDDISLVPNMRNILQTFFAAYEDADADSLAYTLTANYIKYVPKWRVM